MKNLTIFIAAFIFIFLFSCKKDEMVIIYEAGNQEHGWATGTKSGQEWNASGFARYHTEDSSLIGLNFLTFSVEGFLREDLGANEVPLKEGFYEVKYSWGNLGDNYAGGSAAIFGSDGDVLETTYRTNNEKKGFIKINFIDTIAHTIAGEFELFYINNRDESQHPKRLEIKNGEFEVAFYK